MIYAVDRDTRSELSDATIQGENSYVDAFVTRVRDRWSALGYPAYATARRLSMQQEQRFGCDAVIVLRWNDVAKVCLLEAKWPRFSDPAHRWDGIQNGMSHFSHQIMRQSRWAPEAAVWEVFLNEAPVPSRDRLLDDFGATCVPHLNAVMFDHVFRDRTQLWTSQDVRRMLAFGTAARELVGRPVKNMWHMLARVTGCRMGRPLAISRGSVTLLSPVDSESISVPASLESLTDGRVADFLDETGTTTLLFLQFPSDLLAEPPRRLNIR